MAKKPGRKPKRRPNFTVFARIDPDVGAAFESFVAAQPRPRASFAAHVEAALAEYLGHHGVTEYPGMIPPTGKP
jgi:hypothetical protein